MYAENLPDSHVMYMSCKASIPCSIQRQTGSGVDSICSLHGCVANTIYCLPVCYAGCYADGRMCALVEILQQATVLVLQILAQLHGLMQELSNLLKVGLLEPPGCHGRGPNAHPTRGHG